MRRNLDSRNSTLMERKKKEALIKLVKERPAIWDKSCEGYSNRDIVCFNWANILDYMDRLFPEEDLSVVDLKRYWQSLRTQFRDKNKEFKGKTKSATDVGEVVPPKWEFFKELAFLDDGLANLFPSHSLLKESVKLPSKAKAHNDGQEMADLVTEDFEVDENWDTDPLLTFEVGSSSKPLTIPMASTNVLTSTTSTRSGIGGWEPHSQGRKIKICGGQTKDKSNMGETSNSTTSFLNNKEDDDDESKFTKYLASLLRKVQHDKKTALQKDILNLELYDNT
ncbi:hypothetical protein TCAL_17188 [Tigriopus californicus]|uniref:MADF domain-containing protein n=1 Tax=Tigriopus californicus TaxID=6832 RepID=A0A553N8D2_TIGCA|nr:hypothetical protein TCAL_17188 [Tigriopus californicus]